jgi:hypothetical protein
MNNFESRIETKEKKVKGVTIKEIMKEKKKEKKKKEKEKEMIKELPKYIKEYQENKNENKKTNELKIKKEELKRIRKDVLPLKVFFFF